MRGTAEEWEKCIGGSGDSMRVFSLSLKLLLVRPLDVAGGRTSRKSGPAKGSAPFVVPGGRLEDGVGVEA